MNADGYGSVRLIKEGTSVNQAVELAGSIPDFEVTETGTDLVVHDNLEEVFHDPDGDPVTYTVQCDDGALTFSVTDHVLIVNASAGFSGEATAEVVASDGQSEVSDQFLVSMDVTGLRDPIRDEPPVACYPNPFNDMLSITLNLGPVQGSTGTLHIYGLNGARVVSRNLSNLSGDPVHLDVNLEEHPAGSYIVEVVADEQRHTLLIHKR
jgi:hypothetical protein